MVANYRPKVELVLIVNLSQAVLSQCGDAVLAAAAAGLDALAGAEAKTGVDLLVAGEAAAVKNVIAKELGKRGIKCG